MLYAYTFESKYLSKHFPDMYSPFYKTLPRSCAFVNWISARFYEIDCTFNIIFSSCYNMFEHKILVVQNVKQLRQATGTIKAHKQ